MYITLHFQGVYFMKKKGYFIILCIINSVIPMIDLFNKVKEHNIYVLSLENSEKNENVLFSLHSNFSLWFLGIGENKYSSIFFYILLSTTLILCFIFSSENSKQKYPSNTNMSKCYFNTYCKVFFINGFLAVFPLILNFIILSMFVSSIKPDSVYDIFWGIFSDNFFGNIFYNSPFIYLMLFFSLIFAFWGFIGCIEYGLTFIFKNKVISLLLISISLLGIHFIQYHSKSEKIFSPLSIFNSYECLYNNYIIIFTELVFLIIFSGFCFLYPIRKNNLANSK